MKELEDKKRIIKHKLENELFVDRYSTFKESVDLINTALENFGIDYHYNYNEFCTDFMTECLKFMDDHPEVDLEDTKQMAFAMLPIIMTMIFNVTQKNNPPIEEDKK